MECLFSCSNISWVSFCTPWIIFVYTSTERWVSTVHQNPKESPTAHPSTSYQQNEARICKPVPFRPITHGRYETHRPTRTARAINLFPIYTTLLRISSICCVTLQFENQISSQQVLDILKGRPNRCWWSIAALMSVRTDRTDRRICSPIGPVLPKNGAENVGLWGHQLQPIHLIKTSNWKANRSAAWTKSRRYSQLGVF
jgi:hypothetical protein